MLIQEDKEHDEYLLHEQIYTLGLVVTQEIQRYILEGIFTAQSLSNFLEINNYDTDKFYDWGEMLLEIADTPITIQLAPDGVITYIYPSEGFESVLGINLFEDERRDDGAHLALETRELIFIGPLSLIANNELAVIVRNPVFKGDTFWGFATVILETEDIVNEIFTRLEHQNLYFKLEGSNPDSNTKPTLFETEGFVEDDLVELVINVPNGNWNLKIGHDPINNQMYLYVRLLMVAVIIVFSTGVYTTRVKVYMRSEEINGLNQKLYQLSMEDELTGVANRRAGNKHINSLIAGVQRYEKKLSLILLDLDRFKNVNDTYGHQIGDDFLKHFVCLLKSSVRESDIIIRQGGDEFMILLPETDRDNAITVASKIMETTADNPFRDKGVNIPVSLSMGVVELRDDLDGDELLARADQLLYKAKHAGRGCFKY